MLSKCLNPRCSAIFQYLGQGRLFRIDFAEAGRRHPRAKEGREIIVSIRRKASAMEHFWLCEKCAAAMTIELSATNEVHLVTIEASAPKPVALAAPRDRATREAAAS